MELLVALSDGATIATSVGAALVGAIVGGSFTYWGSRTLEEQRQADADRRQLTADVTMLNAACRLHLDIYANAVAVINASLQRNIWPPEGTGLAPSLPEHRLLIARYLSYEAWDTVRVADAELFHLMTAIADEEELEPMTDEDRQEFESYRSNLLEAMELLDSFARMTVDDLLEAYEAEPEGLEPPD